MQFQIFLVMYLNKTRHKTQCRPGNSIVLLIILSNHLLEAKIIIYLCTQFQKNQKNT